MAVRQATLAGLSRDELLNLHHQMVLLRRFEEKAAEEYTLGKIGGFLHLYIGQEANGAGIISALQPDDYILAGYREHGYALLRGLTPRAVMAELFGRATGCRKGKGGSMHMYSDELHLIGGQAIVGAQLVMAAGIRFAIQYQEQPRVAVALFGDGAGDQGAVHEAMDPAAHWKLPGLFICDNKQYSIGVAAANENVDETVEDAVRFADESADPTPDDLYADGTLDGAGAIAWRTRQSTPAD